jgi:Sigma-70 region 2
VRVKAETERSGGDGDAIELGGDAVGKATLSDSQRRLVSEHLGLVGVHLRRYVGNLIEPRHDREREDLFQEGCLGLMRAAVDFDESRGIPFAAFALPRIHNAVSRALETKFSTVHVPWRLNTRGMAKRAGRSGSGGDCGSDRGGSPDRNRHPDYPDHPDSVHSACDLRFTGRKGGRHRPDGPVVRSMSDGPDCEARCAKPDGFKAMDCGETLGDRLRGKYERAIRRACELVLRRSSARGDRKKLAEMIAEERLLIPEETHRRALRQIARDTGSSYARVSDCERRMMERAREMLVGDPEFGALTRRAKATEAGVAAGLDDVIERELADASASEFVRRFEVSARSERAAMLERLIDGSSDGFSSIVERQVAKMNASQRETLLAD